MKSFFKHVNSSDSKAAPSSTSLWSKLRREVDGDNDRNRAEVAKEGLSMSPKQRFFRPPPKGRAIGKGKSDIPKSIRKEFDGGNDSDETIPPALQVEILRHRFLFSLHNSGINDIVSF